MPRELRQIVFSGEEFMQAIVAYDRMSPDPILAGQVIGCRLEKNEPIETTNRIVEKDKPTEITMTLEPLYVRRALVRFCIENNIMIPRDSVKSVATRKGRIALVIRMPAPGVETD